MNYYRISFNRITVPDPDNKPLHRHWEWYDLVCEAQNYDEARDHGRHVASVEGVQYVSTVRLPRVVGAVEINRSPAFQQVPNTIRPL